MTVLRENTIVSFMKDEDIAIDLRNFWPAEDGFVWSEGKWCEITFDYDLSNATGQDSGELILDISSFIHPPQLEGQNVHFYLNGLRIGSRQLTKRITAFIDLPAGLLRQHNTLIIDTPDASAPSQFGLGDNRVLGIQLFTFQVRLITSSDTAPVSGDFTLSR